MGKEYDELPVSTLGVLNPYQKWRMSGVKQTDRVSFKPWDDPEDPFISPEKNYSPAGLSWNCYEIASFTTPEETETKKKAWACTILKYQPFPSKEIVIVEKVYVSKSL